HIRYYLFAILFMIFEVEVAFLFPWAVILKSLGVVAYVEMLIFLAILVFGLVYAWKKGVLEWAG
ncbi:MAG: NADH-quinone oxidoreductase subunit A, partial [Chloroflexi bacterium]|nr:NADH-quinone oxidoreductase subunit A [Chloroflexota bacterium]